MKQMVKRFSNKLSWRLCWLSVLLLHIPASIKVLGLGTTEGEINNLAASLMMLTNVVFLLEIVFCPVLLLCASRKRLIALLLIITLLHAGVIQDATINFDWELIPITFSVLVTWLVAALLVLIAAVGRPHADAFLIWSQRARPWLPRLMPRGYFLAFPAHAPPPA